MTVLKASLSSYRLVNTKKSMSVVCIERRIPASANLMTISHSYCKIVYICGDYNIDLLHYEERAETKYFLDQMFSSGLYPLITRPTRITGTTATIIDNIFCSELCRNKVCGIVLSDATNICQFSFCVTTALTAPTVKYKRKLDEDSLSRLEHDLNDINWEIVMNESNPN